MKPTNVSSNSIHSFKQFHEMYQLHVTVRHIATDGKRNRRTSNVFFFFSSFCFVSFSYVLRRRPSGLCISGLVSCDTHKWIRRRRFYKRVKRSYDKMVFDRKKKPESQCARSSAYTQFLVAIKVARTSSIFCCLSSLNATYNILIMSIWWQRCFVHLIFVEDLIIRF